MPSSARPVWVPVSGCCCRLAQDGMWRGATGSRHATFSARFSLSLTPCAPLASLLAVCALSGGALSGVGYGLSFGLGAALTPLLIIVPLLSLFGRNLREGRQWLGKWLRWGAAVVLIAIGLRRLIMLF